MRRPTEASPRARRPRTPLTVSGADSGRARRSVDRAAFACGGAAGWVPRMDSMGVASTTLPPYSPIDSEIAPTTRGTPAASGQVIGEPEKPGPTPVASTAGPDTETRIRGPIWAGSPSTTSSTSALKVRTSVPRITDAPVHRMPACTCESGMIGSAASAGAARHGRTSSVAAARRARIQARTIPVSWRPRPAGALGVRAPTPRPGVVGLAAVQGL